MLESGQLLTSVSKLLESGDVTGQELGTLFLDGVDELNVDCQRVLLSILQKEETVTGKRKGLRLISTATRSLEREIELGRFRRELYFRIAGVCLHLPRLRDRKEDIPALMEFLLEKHAGEMGRKAPNLRDDEMELLLKYGWPGNIRELGNLAKKIAALGDARATIAEMRGTPTMRDRLMEMPPNTSLKVAARTASRLAERDLILKALDRTHWNRKQAARDLQISYKALLYKIKQMNVPGEHLKKQQGEE
jgi:two-component system response regulator AtoC